MVVDRWYFVLLINFFRFVFFSSSSRCLSYFLRFLFSALRLREAMLCFSSELTGNIVVRRFMAASLSIDESLDSGFSIWARDSMWDMISAGDWVSLGASSSQTVRLSIVNIACLVFSCVPNSFGMRAVGPRWPAG